LLLIFFLRPAVEVLIMAVGEWWVHARFRQDPGRFSRLIIQITTVGREPDRVNEILWEIHSKQLSMPYETWVVTEPGDQDSYSGADRLIVVPPQFQVQSQYKARALEYSRRIRHAEGLDRDDVKILYLDDDTSPTLAYIETAFAADYDLSQGAVANRNRYGSLPLQHFFLSHMDDLRLLGCFTYCALSQGVLGRPLYVHGEGLTVTGSAEASITWDYPMYASEDLVFGHNGADLGHTWGYFHEYIENTSPWTWQAFVKQRRRWLWGNLHGIGNRDVLPLGSAIALMANYVLGSLTYVASVAAVVLLFTGVITNVPYAVYVVYWSSFACWIGSYAMSGWINSGRDPNEVAGVPAYYAMRCWQALAAALLAPITATWAFAVGIGCFYQGDPKNFEVIAKTEQTSHREEVHSAAR
jgi:Glycosyl transferase family group 2